MTVHHPLCIGTGHLNNCHLLQLWSVSCHVNLGWGMLNIQGHVSVFGYCLSRVLIGKEPLLFCRCCTNFIRSECISDDLEIQAYCARSKSLQAEFCIKVFFPARPIECLNLLSASEHYLKYLKLCFFKSSWRTGFYHWKASLILICKLWVSDFRM